MIGMVTEKKKSKKCFRVDAFGTDGIEHYSSNKARVAQVSVCFDRTKYGFPLYVK